jgi:DMSO/TMAO reductase YedYZ heme-binding membrane subunit
MKKLIGWAEVCARLFILLLLYILSAPFFVLTWLGAIGQVGLSAFASFQTQTAEFIAAFDQQLKQKR